MPAATTSSATTTASPLTPQVPWLGWKHGERASPPRHASLAALPNRIPKLILMSRVTPKGGYSLRSIFRLFLELKLGRNVTFAQVRR